MRYIAIVFLICCTSTNLLAQNDEAFYKTYDWEEVPEKYILQNDDSVYSAVIIKDFTRVEHEVRELAYVGLMTKHIRVRVNSEKGLEDFNKVYIPISGNADLLDIKARAISENGDITTFDSKNIVELSNIGNAGNFKIFAIEGALVNSEIEVLYTIVTPPFKAFDRIYAQKNVPVNEFEYEIKIPAPIKYKFKSYNGLATYTSSEGEKHNFYALKAENIRPYKEESYAAIRANRKSFDYVISSVRNEDRFTWHNVSQVYLELLNKVSSEDKKALNLLRKNILQNKVYNTKLELAQIVENYLKSNFKFKSQDINDNLELRKIIANGYSNEIGMAKLYYQVFESYDIEFLVLLTANRFNSNFDTDFPSLANIQDVLFYFPEHEMYLSPSSFGNRIGIAPSRFATNRALQIATQGYTDFHEIRMPGADENLKKATIDIAFSNNFNEVVMNRSREVVGYTREIYRSLFGSELRDNTKDRFEPILEGSIKGIDVNEITIKNGNINDYSNRHLPVTIESLSDITPLVQKAGNDYLFNIGMVIGKQTYVQPDLNRINQIVLNNPFKNDFTINFEIPEGYKVNGLDDLVIKTEMKDNDGNVTAMFTSSYSIEGSQVQITISEHFMNTTYESDKFNEFRKIMNSASEFNSSSIIFIKE